LPRSLKVTLQFVGYRTQERIAVWRSFSPEALTLTRRTSSPVRRVFYPGVPVLLEASFNIAWDYLQRTNALQDDAARFLTDEIERLIRKGHKNRMVVANIAITKYREFSNKVVPLRD
jgi:hypothetical protein